MVFNPDQTTHPRGMLGDRRSARALVPYVGKTYAILGVSGSATLVVGAVMAVACTAWALRLDVPHQVAFLAGYITMAASACICAALVAVRHSAPKAAVRQSAARAAAKSAPKPAAKTEPIAKVAEPDYAAWKRVEALRVADASRLWCGIEPGHPANPEVMAWAAALLEAIERGELENRGSTGVLAQYKIGWHTEVQRHALKAWAESKGHSPRFLRD
jgi:hypothetical protein